MDKDTAEAIAANFFTDIEYLTRETGEPIPEAKIVIAGDGKIKVDIQLDKNRHTFNLSARRIRRIGKQKATKEITDILENPSLYAQQVEKLEPDNPTKQAVQGLEKTGEEKKSLKDLILR